LPKATKLAQNTEGCNSKRGPLSFTRSGNVCIILDPTPSFKEAYK